MDDKEKALAEQIEDIIHIRAVRFGAMYPKGFLFKDIEKKYKTHRKEEWEVVNEFLTEATNNKTPNATIQRVTPFIVLDWGARPEERTYTLSYEAAFHYVNLLELQQTREMARDAHRSSTIAIRIAIASMVIAGALSLWQIFSPVSLERGQYHNLIKSIRNN